MWIYLRCLGQDLSFFIINKLSGDAQWPVYRPHRVEGALNAILEDRTKWKADVPGLTLCVMKEVQPRKEKKIKLLKRNENKGSQTHMFLTKKGVQEFLPTVVNRK